MGRKVFLALHFFAMRTRSAARGFAMILVTEAFPVLVRGLHNAR
jgi:hypothetical protein